MKTIWKFELEVLDMQGVDMPEGAEVLTVQTQRGTPCLWALVDAGKPKVKRTFVTHGTGHPVIQDDNKTYIGSYQLDGGSLVFHVFEL